MCGSPDARRPLWWQERVEERHARTGVHEDHHTKLKGKSEMGTRGPGFSVDDKEREKGKWWHVSTATWHVTVRPAKDETGRPTWKSFPHKVTRKLSCEVNLVVKLNLLVK